MLYVDGIEMDGWIVAELNVQQRSDQIVQSTLTRKTLCVKPASESLGRCSQLGRRGESIYGTAGSYFPAWRGMDHSDARTINQNDF